jgi:hypothetical protein
MEGGDYCMSSIDERVVQMKFDNAQFESKIAQTQSTLEKFKSALNLSSATKSVEELDTAGKNFSLAGMADGIEKIGSKFTALGVIGVTALASITTKALDTGLQLAKSLTIAPIADGYADYERKLSSVQTIMNATGESLTTVNGYFGQLDTYADKTIYNLDDMTGAFAKFTNAGVGMDKSVPAIKGIANMTALAGQDAGAASIAMYNLSQSIAGGFLTTTDYKSLNLANIATKEWKDQMIQGAVAAGTLKKSADGNFQIKGMKKASTEAELFNDNLAEGWATTEVMMKVLGDYGDVNTAIGKKAQSAAQDVKSWGMMMETLSAGVGTGWTDTFELLVGNVEQAKKLFTPLTETIGGFLDEMSASRNDPLKEWNKLGGREVAIQAVVNAFHALMDILKPIKDAFTEIFPPTTGKQIFEITTAIRDFTAGLKPSAEVMDAIKRTFKGVFAVLDIGRMIIVGVAGVFGKLFGSVAGGGAGFLSITAKIGDFLVRVRDAIKNGEGLTKFFDGLGDVLKTVVEAIRNAATWIGNLFKGAENIDTSGITNAVTTVQTKLEPLKRLGEMISNVWKNMGKIFNQVVDFFKPMAKAIGDFFGDFGRTIGEAFKTLDFSDVLALVNTGLLGGLVLLFKKFLGGGLIDQIKEAIFGKKDEAKGPGMFATIKETLGGLTDSLKTMQTTLKAATLIIIAGAIALLTASIVVLSKIDSAGLTKALGAMAAMFSQLMISMAILDKMNIRTGVFKMGAIGGALVLLAIAIRILAGAVEKLSGLSWQELLKGLLGVTALLAGLAGAMNLLPANPSKMISTGIGMIAIAFAIKILASAVKDMAALNLKELAKGLGSVGTLLGALALFTRVAKVNKGAMGSAIGLILLGAALKIIASVVKDLSTMSGKELGKGLGSITAILGVLAQFSRVVNPAQMVSMGVSMVIIGAALKIIASAVKDMGAMSVKELVKGLGALTLILGGIAVFSRVVNPAQMITMGIAMVLIGGALKILSGVLKDLGGMSWEEIAKGMVALGGSLAILAGAMYLMGLVLPGAAALIIAAGALALLAPALATLGKMSWDEIGRGLTMLAASLVILSLGGVLLLAAIPGFLGLGVAALLLGTGLMLAGIGMTAFAAALGVLAVTGAAATAVLVGTVTALLGLIPYAMTQFGLGLVALAGVITMNAPAFGAAFMAVLGTILNVINVMSPQIVATMWGLIQLLVTTVVNGVPWLVDAGMKLLVGILNGIAANIGSVVDAATNVIVNFLNGLANNMPRITQAGADLIITFVESLATTVRNNSERMGAAGGDLAAAIIEGMANGIGAGVGKVVEAAKRMASNAFEAAKDFLDINSPSRKFRDLGESTGEGYVVGMDNYQTPIRKSAEALGNTALTSLQKTMGRVSSAVNTNLKMNPTIKPVIDLTEVRKGARGIGGLLTPPTLNVSGAYAKASSLAVQTRANEEATVETKTGAKPSSGDHITFNQYNNSPKALSSAEIYRKTNNQMSQLKKKEAGV